MVKLRRTITEKNRDLGAVRLLFCKKCNNYYDSQDSYFGMFTMVVLVWAFINIMSLFSSNPNLDSTFGKIFLGTVTGLLTSIGGYTTKRCTLHNQYGLLYGLIGQSPLTQLLMNHYLS